MNNSNQMYIRASEITDLCGIGLSTVWKWNREREDFPKSHKLSDKCTVWNKQDILNFIEKNKVKNKVEDIDKHDEVLSNA